MKTNELMIGDIVRVSKDVCFKKGTIVKIHGIDADNAFIEKGLKGSATCMQVNDQDRFTGGVWCDFLEPIPLTPEILEKNLATEHQISWCIGWDRKDDIHVEIKRENLHAAFYGVIDFVHELQHALRLCGIEKEIEL